MQFRHSRRWPGVEPRFFARHLARNLLPTPSCPALLAAVDSPVLTALPAWVAHLCAPATGPATHTAAACESPVRRPIAANCNPSSDPQLVACLPNSNADTSFLASFAAPWGVFCCLILGGHSTAMPAQGILPIDPPPNLPLLDRAASETPQNRAGVRKHSAVPELQCKRVHAREHGCLEIWVERLVGASQIDALLSSRP